MKQFAYTSLSSQDLDKHGSNSTLLYSGCIDVTKSHD